MTHSVTNHFPFRGAPSTLPLLHPRPSSPAEHFENSTHVADHFLKEFFVQLEARPRYREAIVVVLGDHGFPCGEHGATSTRSGSTRRTSGCLA